VNHRGGESELFLHPVGVVGNHGLGTVGKLHEFQKFVAAFAGGGFVEAVHAADKFQVFRRGEAMEEAHTFRNNTDLAFYFDRIVRKIDSQKGHAAGCRSQQACKHFDGGGFTRAVWSEEAKELAGFDLEINVVYRSKGSETAGQLFCGDGDFRHGRAAPEKGRKRTLARLSRPPGAWLSDRNYATGETRISRTFDGL
jgi:hypothetical protein